MVASAATPGNPPAVSVPAALELRRRRYRILMVLAAGASYAVDVLCLSLFWSAGEVAGSVPLLYALAGALHVVLFTGVHASGLSSRARQPHLPEWQAVYAIGLELGAMALAPQAGAYFLAVIFVIFAFAMLRLRLRSALLLWLLTCAAVALVAMHVPTPITMLLQRPSTYASVLVGFSFATVLLRLILLTRYAAHLRSQASLRAAQAHARAKQAEARANHDGLTGALNRPAILPGIADQIDLLARGRSVAALAMIDIDHFKDINDRHGHLVGDQVLRRLVERIHDCIRATDKLARYGGEEFLLLMPMTTADEATALAERLREAAAELDLGGLAPGLALRISIGVTSLDAEDTVEHAIDRADRALYQAKATGRDRVVLLQPAPAPALA